MIAFFILIREIYLILPQIEYFDASDQVEASFLELSLSSLEIPHYLELEGIIIFYFSCS